MSNHESVLKHLEFIQNVITRMNSNSFVIKGWAVTIVAALLALCANKSLGFPVHFFLCIATLVIFMFWMLDAYYLSQERQYRELYNETICDLKTTDLSMNASGFNSDSNTWLCSFFSKTLTIFFGLLVFLTYVLALVLYKG